jgi:hypothetical protein
MNFGVLTKAQVKALKPLIAGRTVTDLGAGGGTCSPRPYAGLRFRGDPRLMPYRGRPTFWTILLDPEGTGPVSHVHSCPECYEYVPCTMACALEPDLELDDGTPCGAHCICDRCESFARKGEA